jgi:hypothetical protein
MPPPTSPWVEKRAWTRRRNRFRVLLADSKETLKTPMEGWVVDRSPGGLRLSTLEDIETGTSLKVRPIGAPVRTPWITVRVKNRQQKGDVVELGCKFVEPPPLMTLLLFG